MGRYAPDEFRERYEAIPNEDARRRKRLGVELVRDIDTYLHNLKSGGEGYEESAGYQDALAIKADVGEHVFGISPQHPGVATCTARFLKQRLKDPEQDARMQCARLPGHRQRHTNKAGDLTWDQGLEVDVKDLLDERDEEENA